jgi:hypothetical protein
VAKLRADRRTGTVPISVPGVAKPYIINLDTYITCQDAGQDGGKALGFEHLQPR